MRRQAWGGGMLVGLALLIATLVGFVTAVQASERETAEQLLAETLAPLIEIDALLDRELAGMVERAREPDTTAVIAPNFPLAVSLPAALVAGGTRAEVRAQMLEAGAALVYAQGTSAFRREPGSGGGAPFSVQGAIRFGLERLTAGTHSTARAALIALAVVTAVVLGLTLAQAAEGTRLRRAGLALILGGVVVLVAGVGARIWLAGVNDGGDAVSEALRSLGRDVSGMALRNAVVTTGLGATLVALGWMGTGQARSSES